MTSSPVLEILPAFRGNSRSRLKKRTLLFRYLAEINLILGLWYLVWRTTHSLNLNVLWLAVPLLLAEIYGYIGGAMFMIGLWRPLERQIKSIDQLSPPLAVDRWPTVDVFVTCYNEPAEMVEETTRAALAMDYPATKLRVYILDDGSSAAMRAMAERLCLEDLQSPALQQAAQRIDEERQAWGDRLLQLQQLIPETVAAETWLQESADAPLEPGPGRWLQAWERLILLLHPEQKQVGDRLRQEIQQVEADRHRAELALADLARCRYIARPKPAGKAHHAKAGNINYAIFSGETSGSFILTLDADHLPRAPFLKRVLPYFFSYNLFTGKYESNRIAFVQTPQDFYNLPPDDPFGHRAHLFYGPIQQGKDGLNSAFYTGTNAILRREALVNVGLQQFSQEFSKDQARLDEFELIGGMSSASITEDMNTAMRLHAAGWRSAYHNELLATGLAPDDLSSTLKQRLRWAQGTIQVLQQENPLTKNGLSFWQRLQYFQTMYSYFSGFATLIFLICPLIYFFTGIIPVQAYGPDFALHFFPAFVVNRLTFVVAAWGIPAAEVWRSEQYAVALFPLFIQAVWSVFTRRPIKFQVTPKQRQSGVYLRLVRPQLVLFSLTLAGMGWGLYRDVLVSHENAWVYLINVGWAIYGLCLLGAAIKAAVWQPPATPDSIAATA